MSRPQDRLSDVNTVYEFISTLVDNYQPFQSQDWPSSSLSYKIDQDNRIYFKVLDASKMKTFDELSEVFRKEFKFGDHYGENWNALVDCMRDVPIEKYDGALIMLRNADLLMSHQPKELNSAISFFGYISEDWATPIEQGEWFDRPGKRVVFILHNENKKNRLGLPIISFSGG